jgi:hypothetical protein
MLANMNFHTSSLVDDSTLCAKKDIIISKFDQLLKKLGGEVWHLFDLIYIISTNVHFRKN